MAGGGSTSTKVEIPEWMENAAKDNLARGNQISTLGFQPNYADRFAAFSPMQNDAFANTNATADAFGMQSSAGNGMPTPTTFSDGSQSYSSIPLFDSAVADFRAARPGQAAAYDAMFIDPYTGAASTFIPVDNADANAANNAAIQEVAATLAQNSNNQSQSVFDKFPINPVVVDPIVDPVVVDPIVDPDRYLDPLTLDQKKTQNQIVVDAFSNYDALTDGNDANPAYNAEAAAFHSQQPVSYLDMDTGLEVTKLASDLTSNDFAAATGATYSGDNSGGLGSFNGGGTNGNDALTMQQYDMAGKSIAGAGIRNIGGSYAGGIMGANDIPVNSDSYLTGVGLPQIKQFNPATGMTEIVNSDNPLGHQIINSIFTMGGLLGTGTPAPLPTSNGQERREMAVQGLVSAVEEYGRNSQEIIDRGLLSGLGPSETSVFTNKYGSLTSDEVAAQAIKTQKAFASNDGKEIRKELQSAGSNLGAYADAFKKSGAFTNPEHFQEKTGISPTTLANMRQVISAREGTV